MFEFKIVAKDRSTSRRTKARTGVFTTPHGDLATPELAFVATEGELKSIPKEILKKLPVKLIIVNTFHLWTKKMIQKKTVDGPSTFYPLPSGIHDFSGFPRPIMSDSGGFQVFSMGFGKTHGVGKMTSMFPQSARHPEERSDEGSHYDQNNPVKISDNGVTFPWEGNPITLSPEKSIQLQRQIGADIIFAFDECTSPLNSYEYTKEALGRTHRWLKRCIREFHKTVDGRKLKVENDLSSSFNSQNLPSTIYPLPSRSQALFAIVQGGYFKDLREKSAKYMARQDVAGFGIGGSLGRSKADMYNVLEWVIPHLPENKPRHLLGIGQVPDIFESVRRGVDTFDCVIPTREARHKVLYTKTGKINLRSVKNLDQIIEKGCRCLACRDGVTFKKLYHFFLVKNPKGFYYATIHNIAFFAGLMKKIRASLTSGTFHYLKERYLKFYIRSH